MKPESLVMVDQLRYREYFPGLVHTARHVMKAAQSRSIRANRKGAGS